MAKNPWAFRIDYAKEIARDEADIKWLSSEAAMKVAAGVEELHAQAGSPSYCRQEHWSVIDLCIARPELADCLGLSKADLAALAATLDYVSDEQLDKATALWGIGRYADGMAVWKRMSVDGMNAWQDWRPVREQGRQGRLMRLKAARTGLARHKRNATRFGGK